MSCNKLPTTTSSSHLWFKANNPAYKKCSFKDISSPHFSWPYSFKSSLILFIANILLLIGYVGYFRGVYNSYLFSFYTLFFYFCYFLYGDFVNFP